MLLQKPSATLTSVGVNWLEIAIGIAMIYSKCLFVHCNEQPLSLDSKLLSHLEAIKRVVKSPADRLEVLEVCGDRLFTTCHTRSQAKLEATEASFDNLGKHFRKRNLLARCCLFKIVNNSLLAPNRWVRLSSQDGQKSTGSLDNAYQMEFSLCNPNSRLQSSRLFESRKFASSVYGPRQRLTSCQLRGDKPALGPDDFVCLKVGLVSETNFRKARRRRRRQTLAKAAIGKSFGLDKQISLAHNKVVLTTSGGAQQVSQLGQQASPALYLLTTASTRSKSIPVILIPSVISATGQSEWQGGEGGRRGGGGGEGEGASGDEARAGGGGDGGRRGATQAESGGGGGGSTNESSGGGRQRQGGEGGGARDGGGGGGGANGAGRGSGQERGGSVGGRGGGGSSEELETAAVQSSVSSARPIGGIATSGQGAAAQTSAQLLGLIGKSHSLLS